MSERVINYFNMHVQFQVAAKAVVNKAVDAYLAQGLGQAGPKELPILNITPGMVQSLRYDVYRAIMDEVDPATGMCKTSSVIPGPKFGEQVDESMKRIVITCARLNNKIIALFPEPKEP